MKNVSAAVASNVSRSCPLILARSVVKISGNTIRKIERAGEKSLSGDPNRERERERDRPSAF